MREWTHSDWLLESGHTKSLVITDGVLNNGAVTGATVTIGNDILHAESFRLEQSLCSANVLEYGSCEAAKCSFTISDNIPTVKGKTLRIYLVIDNDRVNALQLGVFKVAQDKLTADRTKREVVMYDAMYDIINSDVAAWYKTLLPSSSSSTTMQAFRASFLSHFGITAESKILANDAMTIKRTLNPDTLSGADVIRAICEINGCFGTITHEGKFRFFELSPGADDGLFPSDTLYPANDLYPQDVNPNTTSIAKSLYTSVQFEDYNSEAITKLTIKTGDNIGVSVGTDGNEYVMASNFLISDKNTSQLTSIANNALTKMINRYYKPAVVECVGNPCHELGDPIRINTVYRGVVTYILERSLKGIQNLTDTYTAQGEQYYEKDVNGIVSKFEQIEDKTLKIQADVNGIETEVNDLASQTRTSISQLSSEISAKVDSYGGSASSFGWSLTSSGFQLKSNGYTVFDCNSSGTTFLSIGSSFSTTISGGVISCSGGSMTYELGNTRLRFDNAANGSYAAYSNSGIELRNSSADYSLIQADKITIMGQRVFTADVEIPGMTVHNGGTSGSFAKRIPYWRKVSNLADDEYVLCGG